MSESAVVTPASTSAPRGEVGGGPVSAPTKLLTADELAVRWQVPKSHVYRLTREGRLPAVRLGRYYRYRVAAIEGFELDGGCSTPDNP